MSRLGSLGGLEAERRKAQEELGRKAGSTSHPFLDLWRGMFCPLYSLEDIYQFLAKSKKKKGDSEDLCAPYCSGGGIFTICEEVIILPFTTSSRLADFFFFFWLPLPFSKCFCKVTVKANVQ